MRIEQCLNTYHLNSGLEYDLDRVLGEHKKCLPQCDLGINNRLTNEHKGNGKYAILKLKLNVKWSVNIHGGN